MTNIAIEVATSRRDEGIVMHIVRGIAARFRAGNDAKELRYLATLPPYMLADIGFPGFHLMSPKTRKAIYRAAIKQCPSSD